MKPSKSSILNHLKEVAFFLELQGANPFKIRAFERGPQHLKSLGEDKIWKEIQSGQLTQHEGIGKGLLHCLQTYMKDKTSKEWQEAKGDLPESLLELRELSGLGAKKIKRIYDELHVQSLGELEYACLENRLAILKGFGEKTQKKVLLEIEKLKNQRGKLLLSDAEQIYLQIKSAFKDATPLFDLAQKKPIVEKLSFGVKKLPPSNFLKKIFNSVETLETSKTLGRFKIENGLVLEFQVIPESSQGLWWLERRSEKIHFRSLVKKIGPNSETAKTEEELYKMAGVDFHPPEFRENKMIKKFALVSEKDLTGVFHAHTLYSDGANSLEEMMKACQSKGWKYLGISEHSQTAFYADGLKEADLKKQWKEIEDLNKKNPNFYIFKGIESDILKDGKLDYPTSVLKQFDFVIASIHQRYGLQDMTARLLKAIENPQTTMIGHLSGRLLLARSAYEFDVDKIVDAAIKNKVIIELNANPHRLDMDWTHLQKACQKGLLISVNPDAHSVSGLNDVRYGIWMARKAGISKKQIFNTWSETEVKDFLAA